MLLATVLVGCADLQRSTKDLLRPLLPPTPSQAAREALSSHDADARRDSINLLATAHFGSEEPYVRMYRLLSEYPDATVRAACVRALGAHGSVDDAALIATRVEDPAAFVRWEAARALQKIHNPEVVGPLIQALGQDLDVDTRIAAATALGQYPQPRVFEALVGALDDRSYGVVIAAQESLRVLTGQDHGDDGRAWLRWARRESDGLFAGHLTYGWRPYVRLRGFFDVIQFWKSPPDASPRPPKGLVADPPLPGPHES